jgi:hypothetical protein
MIRISPRHLEANRMGRPGGARQSVRWIALIAALLISLDARAGDFPLWIPNEGEGFVEIEWQGTTGTSGDLFGWFVSRRGADGIWWSVTPWIQPNNNDPGPYQWIDTDLDDRVYDYKVTEGRDHSGTLLIDWESDPVRAASDARVPGFVAVAGQPIVVEAESWMSQEPGSGGKRWTDDASAPAGASGEVLVAVPDDETGTCPSTTSVAGCPRLDYRVEFPSSGVYTVWLRGFAGDPSDEGVLVGLDGVPQQRVTTAWTFDAWSWASGPQSGDRIAIDVATAGVHVVNLWMSEDGARIDRFALAPDPGWLPFPPGTPLDPGPPESARSARVLRTRFARSGCSEPIVVSCPADYLVIGGGIDFPDKNGRCSAWDPVEEEFVEAHRKFYGFSSYPEGNGWYCRGESREVDCYAVCAHVETLGITSTTRIFTYMYNGLGTSSIRCSPGKSLIGGGYHSESFWELPKKKEEYKVLGHYHDGDEWRCDDQSRDHYGYCYGLCVSDTELAAVDILETPRFTSYTASCPEGYRVVGGGFAFCDDQSCSASLDEIEARPVLESDEFRCRVGFKESSKGIEAPGCSAVCVRNDPLTVAIPVPEPGVPLQLVAGIAGLGALTRMRRGRRVPRADSRCDHS